jgi:hypothetical protein
MAVYDVWYSMVHAILGFRPPAAAIPPARGRTAGRDSHGHMDQPNKALPDQKLMFG